MSEPRPSRPVSLVVSDPTGASGTAVLSLLTSLAAVPEVSDADIGALSEELRRGRKVTVRLSLTDADLSPQAAADRLGVSRQHLVRLMDAGRLQYRTLPGSRRRRIALRDLDAYAQRHDERRQKAHALGAALAELDDHIE